MDFLLSNLLTPERVGALSAQGKLVASVLGSRMFLERWRMPSWGACGGSSQGNDELWELRGANLVDALRAHTDALEAIEGVVRYAHRSRTVSDDIEARARALSDEAAAWIETEEERGAVAAHRPSVASSEESGARRHRHHGACCEQR